MYDQIGAAVVSIVLIGWLAMATYPQRTRAWTKTTKRWSIIIILRKRDDTNVRLRLQRGKWNRLLMIGPLLVAGMKVR